MASRPVTSATDRYKMLLASALERVCVLEEQLEQALEHIRELEENEGVDVAEPKLQIDRRFDRIERALVTLAEMSHGEAGKRIEKILRGEESEETKEAPDETSSMG